MAVKRRRTDSSPNDPSVRRKTSPAKTSKVPRRRKSSRTPKPIDPFSISLDPADVDQWLSEAEAFLWGTASQPDPDLELAKARAKLERSPDSVEAFLTLADFAENARTALPLYEKAVAAGERTIGRTRFRKLAGQFWHSPKTRPYMQARLALARCLWSLSRRDEAVSHYQDMLRLNPVDNQGIRYLLMNCLISLGRFDDARALNLMYDESSTAWGFSAALISFHDEGDSVASRRVLKSARRLNRHVVPFLIGQKEPPDDPSSLYRPGDKSEAAFYLEDAFGTWKQVPGALAWLSSIATGASNRRRLVDQPSSTMSRRSAAPRATGPTPRAKQRLRKLALHYGTIWQATVARLENRNAKPSDAAGSWMILAVNLQSGQLIVQDLVASVPSTELVWDRLIDAMENPVDGPPGRPAEIHVRSDDAWEVLGPHLQEIDVDVINRTQLEDLDQLISQIHRHLGISGEPGGLLSCPGLTPTIVGRLYASAAEFYRCRPWHFVPMDAPLRIEGTAVGDRPRYCLVMGQSAMTFGVSIYPDLESIRLMLNGCCGGCDNECDADACDFNAGGDGARDDDMCGQCHDDCGRPRVNVDPLAASLAVLFDRPEELPEGDRLAIQKFGWPVAGPEAYPEVFRTAADLTPEPPTADDLRLLAACLMAVPGFASRHPFDRGESPVEEFSFSDGDERLTLAVSWVQEDEWRSEE